MFPKLLSLKERQSVILGNIYKNRTSRTEFIQYIAKSLANYTKNKIENSNFYSLSTDGFSDSSATEKETFVTILDPDPKGNKKVQKQQKQHMQQVFSKNITLIFAKNLLGLDQVGPLSTLGKIMASKYCCSTRING